MPTPTTSIASRSLAIGLRAVAAVLVAAIALTLAPLAAGASTAPSSLEAAELEVVRLHNQARAAAGLAPLDVHVHLHVDARRWSEGMGTRQRLQHQSSSNGFTSFATTSCAVADPGWRKCAENIAAGQPSAKAVHDAWMASSGHRQNLLDPATNRIGVGVWSDGEVLWWTARFMQGTAVDTADSTRHPQDGHYDPNGPEGTVYRLYRAYFLREPDASGFAYWVGRYRAGQSLISIADGFSKSSEFRGTYGSVADRSFVDLVYRNVLGRTPDATGHAYWLLQLVSGMTRGAVMINFSDSAEFRARTADGVPPGYRT